MLIFKLSFIFQGQAIWFNRMHDQRIILFKIVVHKLQKMYLKIDYSKFPISSNSLDFKKGKNWQITYDSLSRGVEWIHRKVECKQKMTKADHRKFPRKNLNSEFLPRKLLMFWFCHFLFTIHSSMRFFFILLHFVSCHIYWWHVEEHVFFGPFFQTLIVGKRKEIAGSYLLQNCSKRRQLCWRQLSAFIINARKYGPKTCVFYVTLIDITFY